MIRFDVTNRWTGNVQFTAEIDCADDAPLSLKLGLAVRWGVNTGANLAGANLAGAYLTGANLTGANLAGAYLTGALEVPVIAALDTKILAAIESCGELDMGDWHTCDTTHCRAGWAITLAGEAGKKLEDAYGPSAAGALIYAKSYPTLRVPNFYASNSEALADIRDRAATDPAPSPQAA